MRVFWILTRLRVAEVLRVSSSAIFFFAFPLAMLLVTAVLFSSGHPFEQPRIAAVGGLAAVPANLSETGARWEPIDSVEHAQTGLRAGRLNAAVAAQKEGWRVMVTPRQRLLGEGLCAVMPKPCRLEVVSQAPWGYMHYLCPGVLAFSVILSGLFGLGYSMARYRQSQFLRKLATTPLSKWTFLASQIAGRGILVLLQCLLLLAVMGLALRLPLSPAQVLWALLLCTLGLSVFLGFGLLLACVVSNESVLSDAINALGWPIVLGSGIFFPTDVLPGPLHAAAEQLPSTQLVYLLRDIVLYGTAPSLSSLAILLAWSAATFAVGGALFDWVKD